MTFLNFSKTFEKCFSPKIKGKHFSENQTKIFFTGKYFLLTNFSNGKQTFKNLKNNFLKTTCEKTNTFLINRYNLKPHSSNSLFVYGLASLKCVAYLKTSNQPTITIIIIINSAPPREYHKTRHDDDPYLFYTKANKITTSYQ